MVSGTVMGQPNTMLEIGSVGAQSRVWLSLGARAASESRMAAGQRQYYLFLQTVHISQRLVLQCRHEHP